jgi:hypothetical protein
MSTAKYLGAALLCAAAGAPFVRAQGITLTPPPAGYLPTTGLMPNGAPYPGNTASFTATIVNSNVQAIITFKIEAVTGFPGDAMNHGMQLQGDPDFKFVAALNPGFTISPNGLTATANAIANSKTIVLSSFDFGGRCEIATFAAFVAGSAFHLVPEDADGDTLPDFYESTQNVVLPCCFDTDGDGIPDAHEDDDPDRPVAANAGPAVIPDSRTPLGLIGDGLVAYEEYRGFFAKGLHVRTPADRKDVFAHCEANVALAGTFVELGFFPNLLNFNVRSIANTEWNSTAGRIINVNRAGIVGATLQRALRVRRNDTLAGGGFPILGAAFPVAGAPPNQSPNESAYIDVNVILHQRAASGDDAIAFEASPGGPVEVIKTGANGICQSPAATAGATGDDDLQVIPVGQGQPNQLCIQNGAGFALVTAPAGDDVKVGQTIHTGPNGICNTAKVPGSTDIQVIALGRGKANSVGVRPGANGILQSTRGRAAGPDGDLCTADDVFPPLNAAQRLDSLRESVGHECGHGCHAEHHFCLGGFQTIPIGDGLANTAAINTGANGLCQTARAGDDVQMIAVGNGQPDQPCVVGLGVFVGAVPLGDDTYLFPFTLIGSGPNGICETPATVADVQIIPVGQGAPNRPCVSTGPDGICQTTRVVDDVQVIIVGRGQANAPAASFPSGTAGQVLFDNGGMPVPLGDDVITAGAAGMPDTLDTGPNGIMENAVIFIGSTFGPGMAISILTSNLLVPVPNTYSMDDLDQIRFHLKHP